MRTNAKLATIALALALTLPAAVPAQAQEVPETVIVSEDAAMAAPAEQAQAPAGPRKKKASFLQKATSVVGGAAAGFAAFKLLQSALKPKQEAPAEAPQP